MGGKFCDCHENSEISTAQVTSIWYFFFFLIEYKAGLMKHYRAKPSVHLLAISLTVSRYIYICTMVVTY